MTEAIQSTDLRRRVREVLDRVRIERQPLIVYTYDTPQAVLIPYDDYAAYQSWQARQQQRQAWLAELRAIAQQVSDRAELSDDEAADLIAEAKDA
jgi:prevent-host-death family protein